MSVVETDRRGRITVITLNRPLKRNALTDEMNVELRDSFGRFADDSDAWVAVLAGNGPDFCAGVDLGNVRRGGDRARPGGITRGFECWKPIIAAVHGNCFGDDELKMIIDAGCSTSATCVAEMLNCESPALLGRVKAGVAPISGNANTMM